MLFFRDRVRSRLLIFLINEKITLPDTDDNLLSRAQSLSAHLANLLYFSAAELAAGMKDFRQLAADELRDQRQTPDSVHSRILDNLSLFYAFAEKVRLFSCSCGKTTSIYHLLNLLTTGTCRFMNSFEY